MTDKITVIEKYKLDHPDLIDTNEVMRILNMTRQQILRAIPKKVGFPIPVKAPGGHYFFNKCDVDAYALTHKQ